MILDLRLGCGINGLLNDIEPNSIDLILTDPPYAITANYWDLKIDLNKFWSGCIKCIKKNGAILIFGCPPFSYDLINNEIARKYYRYDWVWKKEKGTNFQLANKQPLRIHEYIHVFYKTQPTYNPIKTNLDRVRFDKPYKRLNKTSTLRSSSAAIYHTGGHYRGKFPTSVLEFSRDYPCVHGTQKPFKLCEYLIKTYSNENNLIVDPFSGYGTTISVCKSLKDRQCISYEITQEWYNKSLERLKNIL